MTRRSLTLLPYVFLAGTLFAGDADARDRPLQDPSRQVPIVEALPTLAPFQHVRFCLRYPSDCKSDSTENGRIDLTVVNSELLDRVNRNVNAAIVPMLKTYGADLQEGWTIAPITGDCNDYAVTKRHQLIESGLPLNTLRLSVVKTTSGIGHLVLLVATTRGDLVLDNLTEAIRPWQSTDYRWLKIQSATDARLWFEVKAPGISLSQADRKVRLADR